MGKPGRGNARPSDEPFGVCPRRTRGSETSQYPQEEKSIEIPSVAASERGRAQTDRSNTVGVVGLSQGKPGKLPSRSAVEGAWKGQPKKVIVL
jgi:hypothetical protein